MAIVLLAGAAAVWAWRGRATAVAPDAAAPSRFEAGQRWEYYTRPGEEGSTFTVGRVDVAPGHAPVIHISIAGVHLRSGVSVPHVAVRERELGESATRLVETGVAPDPGFEAAYSAWKRQPRGTKFTIRVAEILQARE